MISKAYLACFRYKFAQKKLLLYNKDLLVGFCQDTGGNLNIEQDPLVFELLACSLHLVPLVVGIKHI